MLGIVLGLASSIAWGTSDFLGGLQARRIAALSVLLVSQPVGLALALVVALIFGGSALSGSDAALAIAAGAIIVVALGAFYRAMALGSVSVVATIGALGVLVPVIAGLVQGEHPAAIQADRRGAGDRRRRRSSPASPTPSGGRPDARPSASRPSRRSASGPSSGCST